MSGEVATCRHCRRKLIGDPWRAGERAYFPENGKVCPVNWYGGFVCSPTCDWAASVEFERSMAGGGFQGLSQLAERAVWANWERLNRLNSSNS